MAMAIAMVHPNGCNGRMEKGLAVLYCSAPHRAALLPLPRRLTFVPPQSQGKASSIPSVPHRPARYHADQEMPRPQLHVTNI